MLDATAHLVLNRHSAELLVYPDNVGIDYEVRFAIYDRESSKYLPPHMVIPAGGSQRVPLDRVAPLRRFSVKLQRHDGERWRDLGPLQPLGQLGDVHLRTVTPSTWGVDVSCMVQIRDRTTSDLLHRRKVPAGESTSFVMEGPHDPLWQIELFADTDDRPRMRLSNRMRLVPPDLLAPPPDLKISKSGLTYSVRSEVLLAPLVTKTRYAGGLLANAFIGVWDGDGPVPEATDWALGRQEYHFLRDRPQARRALPQAIYLGVPRSSWGHFLAQGLARVWFALDNPEVPVVWHARRLQRYQQEVLDTIGFKNEQHFMSEPLAVEQLVVPSQGMCIGEYALPAYAQAIGRYPGRAQVPGRRIFLSRSQLELGRGAVKDGGDAKLDAIFARHGYTIVHPEQLTVADQLDELASAEVVVGIEGSALHSVLLLEDPVRTKFWALTRHRGGSGIYAHIKAAKSLQYETLDFTTERARGASDTLSLDLEAIDRLLALTSGFTEDLEHLEPVLERPDVFQTTLDGLLSNAQVRFDARESAVLDAYLLLRRGEAERSDGLVQLENLL